MRKFNHTKRRSKSPELVTSPSTVNYQNQTLPNPNDSNYRRNLLLRLEDEALFDHIMERCNEMSLENAFEPIMKTYFKAQRALVWIYDQKEATYISHSANTKISADKSFLETIAMQHTVTNIPDLEDQQTSEQIASETTDHNLFIPLSLNNGVLIGIIQLTRNKTQEQFSTDDEAKGMFIMHKFTIYGACFFGASSKVLIASNIAQISTPNKTVDNIVSTLSSILKFKRAEFWYYKPKNDEYAKFINETGTFQVMYRCSIGIVAQALSKNKTINLAQSGMHPNFSATPDIDPNIPLLITTSEFDSTIWAMALRDRFDQERFSALDEQTVTVLMPYIARAIAFSSGFSITPSKASEASDMLITKLLDAASDLVSTLDLMELVHRIEEKTKLLLNTEKVRVLLTDNEKKLFFCDFENEIDAHKSFPFTSGIAGKVVSTQQIIRSMNPTKDEMFKMEIDTGNVDKVNSLLSFPIFGQGGIIIAVVSCINKIGELFTETDESEAQSLAAVAGVALQNAIMYHRSLSIPAMFKVFAGNGNIDKDLKLSDFQDKLDEMTKNAQMFTPGASAAIYLSSENEITLFKSSGVLPAQSESYAKETINETEYKIFITEPPPDPEDDVPKQSSRSFVSSRTQGPPKPKPLKTIYCCVPLINEEVHIGVIVFSALSAGTPEEIQMIKTYVSMAIVGIGHKQIQQLSEMWEKKQLIRKYVKDSDSSYNVPEELIISRDEFSNFPNETVDDSFKIIATGFDTFGLFEYYKIPVQNLLMFVLEISGRYGEGFRSWKHTIETFKYLVKTFQYEDLMQLSKQEITAGLIASLSLELDRPDFDSLGPLAVEALAECTGISVSSGVNSMNEILATEECSLFCNIPQADFKSLLKLVCKLAFATDMGKHFEIMDTFTSLMDEGEFDIGKPQNKEVMLELIMKCADLHDVSKEYDVIDKIKNDVADDFFKFGELFRCQGMNFKGDASRTTVDKETSNIGFFTYAVLPLFASAAKVIAGIEPDVDALLSSIGRWKEEIELNKDKEENNSNKGEGESNE